MSSKKASFDSRDPSNVADPKGKGVQPSTGAAVGSRDSSRPSGDTVDFTPGEDSAPPGRATFESRDLSHVDYIPGSPSPAETRVAEKASFYARDPELGTSGEAKPGKKKYMGVERRKENRRSGKDRRGDVRFDLEKSDRRQNEGRREDDHTPKYW